MWSTPPVVWAHLQMLMGRALVPVANVLPTIVVTSLLSGAIVGGVGSTFSIRKHLNV